MRLEVAGNGESGLLSVERRTRCQAPEFIGCSVGKEAFVFLLVLANAFGVAPELFQSVSLAQVGVGDVNGVNAGFGLYV